MQRTFRLINLVALSFAFGGVVIGGSVAQQVQPQSNSKYLEDAEQRFIDYSKDFNSFAKSHENDEIESDIAFELVNVAKDNIAELDAMDDLVYIHDNAYAKKTDRW
jgi:hypothetical protein